MNQGFFKVFVVVMLAVIFLPPPPLPAAAQNNNSTLSEDRNRAVIAARNGDFNSSFRIFNELLKKYPDDQLVLGDYITVLSWNGNFSTAAELSNKLIIDEQPEYALSAAANSLRKNNRLSEAIRFYKDSLKKFPDSASLNAGYSLALTDVGDLSQSAAVLRQFPSSADKDIIDARNYLTARRISTEQEEAALLARENNYHQALEILDRLHASYPNNQVILYDYILVNTWAGEFKKAAEASQSIDLTTAPAYAVAGAAESLRKSSQPQAAYEAYKTGYERFPDNPSIAIGYALITAEYRSPYEGQKILYDFAEKNPSLAEKEVAIADRYIIVLGAKGNPSIRTYSDQNMKNLYLYSTAEPVDFEAARNIILALVNAGAPVTALEKTEQYPYAVTGDEKNIILVKYYTKMVNWAQQTEYSDADRLQLLDDAMNGLDTLLMDGNSCKQSVNCTNTARSSRIMALTELNRNKEAISEFEDLSSKNVEQPNEVLFSVAQAYSNDHQPKKSQQIYNQIIQRPATKDEERLTAYEGLFWAYLDAYDFNKARKISDYFKNRYYIKVEKCRSALVHDLIPADYDYEAGENADILIGQGILNTGNARCAETYFRNILNEAPGNSEARALLADTQDMRGLSFAALDTIALAQITDEYTPYYELAEADFYMNTRQWKKAETKLIALENEQPGYPPLSNLRHKWDIHDSFELRAFANTAFSDSENNDIYAPIPSFNVYLYSKPVFYNWRIFAGYRYAKGNFPEGTARQNVYILGTQYSAKNFEGTLSVNHNDLNAKDTQGVEFDGTLHFNDHWHMSFGASHNASGTPLRVLFNGIDATRTHLGLQYYRNDYTQADVSAAYTHFTDPNDRLELTGSIAQRLYTKDTRTFTLHISGYGMWNTNDETSPYFSPDHLFSGDIGLEYNELIFARYNVKLSHRALAAAGLTNQKNFGTSPIYTLGYHHSWNFFEDKLLLDYGYEFTRPVYDGNRETNHNLSAGLVWRFL